MLEESDPLGWSLHYLVMWMQMLCVDLSTLKRSVWRRRLFGVAGVAMTTAMVLSHLYEIFFGHDGFTGGDWTRAVGHGIFNLNVVLATPALARAAAFQWPELCRRIRTMEKVNT